MVCDWDRRKVVDVADGTEVSFPDSVTVLGWLPDSRSLLVWISAGAEEGFGVVGRDGTGLRKLAFDPARHPAFTGIEIRRTSDGHVLHSFASTYPHSIALSGDRVALLTRTHRIELRDLSGAIVHAFPVDKRVDEISMSGRWIVFAVGAGIRALDTSTGRTSTIATAEGYAIDVSIDGHRVAWAEQRAGPDVIRAVTLP